MKYKYNIEQLKSMAGNPWLTDRERDIFERFYRREIAIEDIAAELDVSRGTVNNALRSIRHKNR